MLDMVLTTGVVHLTLGNLIMWLIAFFFIYLAISKFTPDISHAGRSGAFMEILPLWVRVGGNPAPYIFRFRGHDRFWTNDRQP